MSRPCTDLFTALDPAVTERGSAYDGDVQNDDGLRAAWLRLTRETLPSLAAGRQWPVTADHCFQRILLDHACGGCWYDRITARPAWRHAATDVLARAVALGEAVIAGVVDLDRLNVRSLDWRRHR